ncbi:phytanoyl-CoA dioxygenase family protein [Gammaproteobacteria bacterium]|nr:phytanoyl-CoA dioxygenase family protein [Gammaproteobacteria bacterium]
MPINNKDNKPPLPPYEVTGIQSGNLNFDDFSDTLKKYGVVVFRKFFADDLIYREYKNDLLRLCFEIAKKHDIRIDVQAPLNEIITKISESQRDDIGFLYDLGTRPIKLLSGTRLKTHPDIVQILKSFMPDSIVGFPFQGETLHIFPPGVDNYKYNLPMHQDYPYIMQSPHQLTAYINFGKLQDEGNGGIRIWPGSHNEGLSSSAPAENNLLVTANKEHYEKSYEAVDIHFDESDFAIFDSLLQHEGIQNHSSCTRVVQLIRYSNLSHETSISYGWKSAEPGANRGVDFADVHPELSHKS